MFGQRGEHVLKLVEVVHRQEHVHVTLLVIRHVYYLIILVTAAVQRMRVNHVTQMHVQVNQLFPSFSNDNDK